MLSIAESGHVDAVGKQLGNRCYPEQHSRLHQTNGAQGRDRTTDTAIFSRMLYQLSYLGTSGTRERGSGAPVYSQAGQPCPPRFAFGFAWHSLADEGEACPA
jgi:hypothetical protein